jgi:hypothetical protein
MAGFGDFDELILMKVESIDLFHIFKFKKKFNLLED